MERRRNLPIRSVAIEDKPNAFEVFADDGNRSPFLYQLAFSTPLLASPLLNLSLSAFSLDRDNTAFAAHRERSEGGRAKISVSLTTLVDIFLGPDGDSPGAFGL